MNDIPCGLIVLFVEVYMECDHGRHVTCPRAPSSLWYLDIVDILLNTKETHQSFLGRIMDNRSKK